MKIVPLLSAETNMERFLNGTAERDDLSLRLNDYKLFKKT